MVMLLCARTPYPLNHCDNVFQEYFIYMEQITDQKKVKSGVPERQKKRKENKKNTETAELGFLTLSQWLEVWRLIVSTLYHLTIERHI